MFSDGNFSYGIEPLGTGAVSNFRRRHEKMWKDNAFIFFLSLLFIYLFKQATCNRLSFSRGLWIMFGSCFVRSHFLTVSPLSITYRQCYSISEFLSGKCWIYTQSTTTETFPMSEKKQIICWRQVSEGKVDKNKVWPFTNIQILILKELHLK